MVIEQVADEGAAIQAKRLSTLLHLFKNVMVEADASSDGCNRSVVLGHMCAVREIGPRGVGSLLTQLFQIQVRQSDEFL